MSGHTATCDTIIHISLGLTAGLSAAFFAVLATRLGASAWLLALIASAPYLANLLAPFWVTQARRWGTRGLMVGSLGAASVVLFVFGLDALAACFCPAGVGLLSLLRHRRSALRSPRRNSLSRADGSEPWATAGNLQWRAWSCQRARRLVDGYVWRLHHAGGGRRKHGDRRRFLPILPQFIQPASNWRGFALENSARR